MWFFLRKEVGRISRNEKNQEEKGRSSTDLDPCRSITIYPMRQTSTVPSFFLQIEVTSTSYLFPAGFLSSSHATPNRNRFFTATTIFGTEDTASKFTGNAATQNLPTMPGDLFVANNSFRPSDPSTVNISLFNLIKNDELFVQHHLKGYDDGLFNVVRHIEAFRILFCLFSHARESESERHFCNTTSFRFKILARKSAVVWKQLILLYSHGTLKFPDATTIVEKGIARRE